MIDPNKTTHLLRCTESGKTAYENIIDERFLRKSNKLFDGRRQTEEKLHRLSSWIYKNRT